MEASLFGFFCIKHDRRNKSMQSVGFVWYDPSIDNKTTFVRLNCQLKIYKLRHKVKFAARHNDTDGEEISLYWIIFFIDQA